ncbi:MAG: hypothetical protein HC915_19020 [Anaerolineae bacterium]|nr:hypothetical protein [Anaerolineae bacterium]
MFGLSTEMKRMEEARRTIPVGLVGAGQMGTDIVSQVALIPSQEVLITADIMLDRAVDAYKIAGHPAERVVVAETLDDVNRALLKNLLVPRRTIAW